MNIEGIRAVLASLPAEVLRGPATLFPRVIELYLMERVDSTQVEGEGDMLLFQWGTHDWGQGPSFQLDLTRQVILSPTGDVDDEEMIQQRCCFHYPPATDLAALGSGSNWCHSPDEEPSFSALVLSHTATRMASTLPAVRLDLAVGRV